MFKRIFLGSLLLSCAVISGCSSDSGQAAQAVAETEADTGSRALYLRGEMNDYGVSETYRLRERDGKLCALATLRADWSPYKFKFADAQWTAGSNFGYAAPPGTLREGSGAVKLNPESRFEELRYHVSEDGVYRFCLIKRGDGYYAEVSEADPSELQSLPQVLSTLLE